MHTTQQWLAQTLANPVKMKHWLKRQYIGEFTASVRLGQLLQLAVSKSLDMQKLAMLASVQKEETTHAIWIGYLLQNRNSPIPKVEVQASRYWDQVLKGDETLEELFAAGFHAETMRLERIQGLVDHRLTPPDIRKVFTDILRDEQGHVYVFESLSTPAQRAKAFDAHKAGMDALGLVV